MKKVFLMFLISVISLYAYEELNINNFEEKIKDKKIRDTLKIVLK